MEENKLLEGCLRTVEGSGINGRGSPSRTLKKEVAERSVPGESAAPALARALRSSVPVRTELTPPPPRAPLREGVPAKGLE